MPAAELVDRGAQGTEIALTVTCLDVDSTPRVEGVRERERELHACLA